MINDVDYNSSIPPVPTDKFRDFCRSLLQKRGLSTRKFAQMVEMNPTYVSQILRGLRRPPINHMATWADAFDLIGNDREYFFTAMELEHTPDRIKKLLWQMQENILRQQK